MVQINQNRGHIIVESVNVSCLITSIPNQLIIMAMEQISIIFANMYSLISMRPICYFDTRAII